MRRYLSLLIAAVFGLAMLSGCGVDNNNPAAGAFEASSTSFADGAKIPAEFTPDGADKNPQIGWKNVPEGTEYFAVIVDDPDAPNGIWAHWAVYNISKDVTQLEEGANVPTGATEGKNSFMNTYYEGPQPPNNETHKYLFGVYALSSKIDNADMEDEMTNAGFAAKFANTILASDTFTGEYY